MVAIEANPVLAMEQEARFRRYVESGRLTVLNLGVGKERGHFPFYVNGTHSEWSSFNKEIGTREGKYDEIQVDMLPLREIFERHGVPYYLKIEIEGYDFIALQELHGAPTKPRFISIENGQKHILNFLHQEWGNGVSLADPKLFFTLIGKDESPPVKPGDWLYFNQAADSQVLEVSRLDNPDNSSIFIKVSQNLDPLRRPPSFGTGSGETNVRPPALKPKRIIISTKGCRVPAWRRSSSCSCK